MSTFSAEECLVLLGKGLWNPEAQDIIFFGFCLLLFLSALLWAKELVISVRLNHRSLVERSLLLRDCLATRSTDRGADV